MTPEELKHFTQWVSPRLTQLYVTKGEKKFLQGKIAYWKKKLKQFENATVGPNDYKVIQKQLAPYLKHPNFFKLMKLEEAVKDWGKMNLKAFYKKAGIPPEGYPKRPGVRLGISASKGHYSPGKHIIYIDPMKNKTDSAKMGTLFFEAFNAFQGLQLKSVESGGGSAEDKAWKHITIEFKTSQAEIKRILHKHKAKDYKTLVEKIGIPKKIQNAYCKQRTYSQSKRVPMPPKSILKDPDMRSALYWFQTGRWNKQKQIWEYGYRPHTPGNKESTLQKEMEQYKRK